MSADTHGWRECTPAIMTNEGEIDAAATAVVVQIFAELSDEERQLFHQFSCHSRHGDQQQQVVDKIVAVFRQRVGLAR